MYSDIQTVVFLILMCILLLKEIRRVRASDVGIHASLRHWIPVTIFCLLCMYVFVNWYLKSYPYYGNRAITFFWLCMLGFITGAIVVSRRRWSGIFLSAYIASMTVAACYGFLEYFGWVPLINNVFPPQITGLVGHKCMLSFMLMTSLIWTLWLLFEYSFTSWKRTGLIISLIIQSVTLFFSDSRAPLLFAFASSCIITGVFIDRKNIFKTAKVRYVIYGVILVAGLIPAFLWSEEVWLRFVAMLTNFQEPNRIEGLSPRPVMYHAMSVLFLSHPISGVGLGNFLYLNIPLWPDAYKKIANEFYLPDAGHCEYLEVPTELGLVGSSFYFFFWIGGLAIIVIWLLKRRKDYALPLALTYLMMAGHASFNTATRHMPSALVFWISLGFIWQHSFTSVFDSISVSVRKSCAVVLLAITIAIGAIFFQILAGDFFYVKYKRGVYRHVAQPVSLLQKALKICPFHPNALFETAHIAARKSQCQFALQELDILEETGPNIRPASFVRGYCALQRKEYALALKYADAELNQWPNYLQAKLLKCHALAALGDCAGLDKIKRILLPKTPPDTAKLNTSEPDTAALYKEYKAQFIGSFRASIWGGFLKRNFIDWLNKSKVGSDEYEKIINTILAMPCSTRVSSDVDKILPEE